jgi:hypothetical protein
MEEYEDYDEQRMADLAIRYPDYNEMDTNELDIRISALSKRVEGGESSLERLGIRDELEYVEELMRMRTGIEDDDAAYYARWRASIVFSVGEEKFRRTVRAGESERDAIDRLLWRSRKLAVLYTIYKGEVERLKRFRDWALERKIPLSAALVGVTAVAAAIGILCRKLLEKGADTVAKAADTTNSASKELPPAVKAIIAVVVKSLDIAEDLLIWLASNLWAVVAAVAVYTVSR